MCEPPYVTNVSIYEQTLKDFCVRVLAYTFLEFMPADCVRRDGFYGSSYDAEYCNYIVCL